jgi:uncharacterized protein (DUF1501 family)
MQQHTNHQSSSHKQLCTPAQHVMSRRRLLGTTAASGLLGMGGLGGLVQPLIADELTQSDKQVLFIWIDGGMSQLESWDPKPNTKFGGPFRSIQTTLPGIRICELMPKTADIMHLLALDRGVTTVDNSHSRGVPRIQRGDPKDRGVIYPYFGSAVAKLMGQGNSQLPPYIWVKPGSGGFKYQDAGFLGPQYGALAIGDGLPPPNMVLPETLSHDDNSARNRLRQFANAQYAAGRNSTFGEAQSFVFDSAQALMNRRALFSAPDPVDVELYGDTELGRDMLIGRKMLEAGVRFVKVNSYGWDTHGDNFNGHASLMPRFDQAFSAVVTDLDQRGMLDNTLVIAMSEFGRTPRVNGHVGRDHWPEAWSIVMTGAGIRRGVVIGETNKTGTFVENDAHDIGDFFHTWFTALGVNSAETEYLNNGQPLPIAHDDCSPIKELLA